MEEVLFCTQTPTENVSTVKSAESTESQLESLRAEFKELKTYFQTVPELPGKVQAVSFKPPSYFPSIPPFHLSTSSHTTANSQTHAAQEKIDRNSKINLEAGLNGPGHCRLSRCQRPPVRYGWELFSIWNYNI